MSTIVSTAIMCIAIMCWLFGTFYFFSAIEDDDDEISDILTKFILAIVIGWFATPIMLGIKHGSF